MNRIQKEPPFRCSGTKGQDVCCGARQDDNTKTKKNDKPDQSQSPQGYRDSHDVGIDYRGWSQRQWVLLNAGLEVGHE